MRGAVFAPLILQVDITRMEGVLMNEQKKNKKSVRTSVILGVFIGVFIAGLIILLYPVVSVWINTQTAITTVSEYETVTSQLPQDVIEEQLKRAEEYNDSLRGDPVRDPFMPGSGRALPQNYLDCLNVSDVMATLEIPVINVNLPIYHGVDDQKHMEKGVGHIEGTSLPIGGKGTHSVLAGHTAIPTARLLTDLREVQEGDKFYIRVLDRELIYQVDMIKVIVPEDISDLSTYANEDYVTLVTCTPYGINSHRLLVRGTRIFEFNKTYTIGNAYSYIIITLITGVLALVSALIYLGALSKRRKLKRLSNAVVPLNTDTSR